MIRALKKAICRLRLWHTDCTVMLLEQQQDRVRNDLRAAFQERSDLLKTAIEKGLIP